jgi:hypothetical protein
MDVNKDGKIQSLTTAMVFASACETSLTVLARAGYGTEYESFNKLADKAGRLKEDIQQQMDKLGEER